MKTMKWLLRREFWEHKGAMMWAPLVAAALIVAVMVGSFGYALSHAPFGDSKLIVNGKEKQITVSLASVLQGHGENAVTAFANLYLAVSAPLFIMLAAVVFFYCLSALHDERRDRSILFWKSLPVSDGQTVTSKVLTAALVAPLITIAIAVFMSVLAVLLGGVLLAFHGVNLITPVLSQGAFYLAPLQLLGMLPVYVLWALPTVGWLLLVSSWARSKVFLWAVGTPVLVVIVLKWVSFLTGVGVNMDWVVHNVVARGLLGLVPGAWLSLEKVQPESMMTGVQGSLEMSSVFTQSWMTLAGPSVWVGAAIGMAMIYAASRLRRWKDEG